MRTRIASVLLFILAAMPQLGSAQDIGVGLILGSPTAVTGKMFTDKTTAWDAGFAYSSGEYFLFYSDYLLHHAGFLGRKSKFVSELTGYYGLGGVLAVTTSDRSSKSKLYGDKSGSFGLGVRIPVGVEWRPKTPTLGLYAELAPGIALIAETGVIIQGGIGIRYYF